MHYLNIVIIEADDTDLEDEDFVEEAVQKAMGASEDEGGFYDWYQIGGRWTGYFDGYDPTKDPRNLEQCHLCKGTGRREDEIGRKARIEDPSYTCNGCAGTGQSVRWPSSWARHQGDIMPVASLTQAHIDGAYRIVVSGHGAFAKADLIYRPWLKGEEAFTEASREMPPLDWIKAEFGEGYLAVVVDNHQ